MSEVLEGAGLVVAALAAAGAILLPAGRPRSVALALALILAPVLILGDQWHTTQITDLRADDGRVAVLVVIAVAAVAALAAGFRRWPLMLPLAIIAALPFRVPLHAGGDTANLLVPLYLVLAAAVVVVVLRDWRAPAAAPRRSRAVWVERLLAAVVVLYALQALYSADFTMGLQKACFFLIPFSVAYALLREVTWDRRLLTWALVVVAVEAAAFVAVGTVEFATQSLFWNDEVIRSNEFHTYFRVNSVFWDPNIYGRYLALVIVIAMATLLWTKDRRGFALLTALVVLLWFGLAQTFSQSSYMALFAGLAALAALRWSWRWTLGLVGVGLVGAILVVGLAGGSGFDLSRINSDTGGRANLIAGGVELWVERPLQGYGSGGFQDAYVASKEGEKVPVSISHTEPVTVAAEQGLIGLAAYFGLIVAALVTMTAGIFAAAAGGTAALRAGRSGEVALLAGRTAVLAAFVALLVHTMAYAGFFEDPITWALLALGAALAAPAVRAPA